MTAHGSATRRDATGRDESSVKPKLSRAEPSRFARSHFNRIARERGEKKKEGAKGKGENRTLFSVVPGPAGITLTRTGSTEALGGRVETPELSRGVISSFYISFFTSGPCTHTNAQGWVPRTRTDTRR